MIVPIFLADVGFGVCCDRQSNLNGINSSPSFINIKGQQPIISACWSTNHLNPIRIRPIISYRMNGGTHSITRMFHPNGIRNRATHSISDCASHQIYSNHSGPFFSNIKRKISALHHFFGVHQDLKVLGAGLIGQ
ncbi:Uncharacterised protein [Legionella pneumophila]|nr:Uncharacterised protein [Legionella pneumophila]